MKLNKIVNIINGSTPSTSNPSFWDGDINWITPKDMSLLRSRYISSGNRNITKLGYSSCSTILVPAGTVLLTSRAPIGYVAIANNPLCTNQGFKSMVCNESFIKPQYLYYWIFKNKEYLESIAGGSTFKELSKEQLGNIDIELPSLNIQQHIVNTIGSVDDLIEKYGLMEDKILSIGLRKINLLNSIRDNVSFSKYVTFDKGFEVGSSNYIEKPKNKDGLIPYLRVGDLDSLKDCYIEKGQSLKVCKADDTLIAFDGAPGRMNVGLIGAYSSGIYKVISQNKGFAFFELLSDLNQSIIKDNSQGTTILHASKAIPLLKACEITNDEVDYFERIYRLLVDIKVRKVKCRDIKSILLNKYFTN